MKNLDLMNDERIGEIIVGLRSEIMKSEPVVDEIIERTLASVKSWKYATDEYFTPIPLFHEIHRFKKGRLLKNVKDWKVPGLYSFGFDENDRLVITRRMAWENITFGYENTSYQYFESGEIKYFHTRNYENRERKTALISGGTFRDLEQSVKVDVGLSRSNDWSASAYFYNEDRIVRVVAYSKGWSGMTTYEMIYDEKGLAKIMVGYLTRWKRR
jgi:hypothetical protein